MPMPPPPPPGPPPPGPPSMPAFAPSKTKCGGADNRGALLQSIRQGTKLKKTVTVDKSAPVISGKVAGSSSSSSNDLGRNKLPASSSNGNGQPVANGLGLGGLFAGGIPKLRSTGILTGNTGSSHSLNLTNNVADTTKRPSPEPLRQNTVSGTASTSQLNEALRRQLAGDFRNRGPPPQPPPQRNAATNNTDATDSTNNRPAFQNKNNGEPTANKSTLHRPGGGNSSFLHQVQSQGTPRPAPSQGHGKPHVAPKPPGAGPGPKPATPPKRLAVNGRAPVSRAQSMRVPPASPPFPPPATINGKDFGTIRGVPSAFHQSQENLSSGPGAGPRHHSRNQTLPVNLIKSTAPPPPALNSRPSAPPPSRPPVPPPPSRTGSNVNLKAPLSPPPPPPVAAPPPPPHRTSPAPPPPSHTRPPPAVPSNGPPPPPVRNSSMRNGGGGTHDLDSRFSNLFHPVTDFPAPNRFQGFPKVYSSKNAAANKQQAPLPPNSMQLGNKLWESSTC